MVKIYSTLKLAIPPSKIGTGHDQYYLMALDSDLSKNYLL
jgi:hypothetical protein